MRIFNSPPAAASKATLRDRLRRLALWCALGAFLCYAAGVTAGFLWLRYGRKNEHIGFFDVALLQVRSVQRGLAAQHLVRAQAEWDAKNYQEAYIAFSSALRNDPDNIPGRLAAARFFRAMGANNLSLSLLEDGLARAPGDRRLIEPTFDLLLASGRDRYALELLQKRYGTSFSGSEPRLLQTYQVRATLAAEGVGAAKSLLEKYAGLRDSPAAAPVVARVLWESAERLSAINLLASYLGTGAAAFPDFALLAGWQAAGGQPEDAVQTAQRACDKFPSDPAPRVLLIEMRAAAAPDNRPKAQEIGTYLRDFAAQPEPLALLATLAGRVGWIDLARTLYELGANSQPDVGLLALCYADALARNSRFQEFQQVLGQIEAQATEGGNAAFLQQLRLRQVIAAGALRDTDNVHEFARRLGAALSSKPDQLEAYRRYFQKVGMLEAAAELTPRAPANKTTAGK
jgi:tetratricopeptide (TPR) repeat protein